MLRGLSDTAVDALEDLYLGGSVGDITCLGSGGTLLSQVIALILVVRVLAEVSNIGALVLLLLVGVRGGANAI